jgi:RimJ/RimL family protein N-acetyltransferase
MPHPELPAPAPPDDLLRDDLIELRLLRVLGPADAAARPPALRFLAAAPECRFAIHRRADGARVGRVHLRLTGDPAIVGALGHGGYEVDAPHRRRGYAARALLAVRRLARHYGIAPLWVLIAPDNVASRRTAERAGLALVDTAPAAPEALAAGLAPELCRYAAERP